MPANTTLKAPISDDCILDDSILDKAAPEDPTARRYAEALQLLVEKLKQERNILAAILFGSLAYDQVWERSDIDLYLITIDDKNAPKGSYCLVENGVNIHASLITRSKFKQALEGDLQGSFLHSSFSRSRLLFSKDDSIEDWYQGLDHIGARDREIQLLRASNNLLYYMAKAEKWFQVKKDLEYTFVWIMYCVNSLANIEIVRHGEVPGREMVQHALRLNPELFHSIYTDLIHGPKTAATVGGALDRINGYLDTHLNELFRPVLEFLEEAGTPRTATELDHYFGKIHAGALSFVFEWLADRNVIRKVSSPLRLGEKSKVTVDEAAYYYDGGDNQ